MLRMQKRKSVGRPASNSAINLNIDQTGHQAKVTFTNQVGLTALNNVGFAEELGISHLNAHSMIGATARKRIDQIP